jgi:hypothetical protein
MSRQLELLAEDGRELVERDVDLETCSPLALAGLSFASPRAKIDAT